MYVGWTSVLLLLFYFSCDFITGSQKIVIVAAENCNINFFMKNVGLFIFCGSYLFFLHVKIIFKAIKLWTEMLRRNLREKSE